jgi:ribosomal protein S18 acetylase RimI-like enzyme
MTLLQVEIRLVNWNDPVETEAVTFLTNHYATHEFALGRPLSKEILDQLVPKLRQLPTARVFLAWEHKRPIGIATCLLGFSTFKASELINVHDLAVHEDYRGRGVGRQLLEHIQRYAIDNGLCAVTLEVRSDNVPARKLYHQLGFCDLDDPLPSDHNLFGKWSAPN